MLRLILIAVTIFLAIYHLALRFNASQQGDDGLVDVVNPRSDGFLMAVIAEIAVLSVMFILPRLGVSSGVLLQKAMALFLIIRAFLPF